MKAWPRHHGKVAPLDLSGQAPHGTYSPGEVVLGNDGQLMISVVLAPCLGAPPRELSGLIVPREATGDRVRLPCGAKGRWLPIMPMCRCTTDCIRVRLDTTSPLVVKFTQAASDSVC